MGRAKSRAGALLLSAPLLAACSTTPSERHDSERVSSAVQAVTSSSFVPPGYGCVWSDEFGGDQGSGQAPAALNSDSWAFEELSVNGEAQVYTTKQCTDAGHSADWNYCVADGRLRIQGRHEAINCDLNHDGIVDNPVCAPHYNDSFHGSAAYSSGRLISKHKVHYPDGYIEFRVKLPEADRAGLPESGIWPAIWMLGENINQGPAPGSVNWPACGEIDIMEWATSGGQSQQGWNAIWLGGDHATNACSAWPEGGSVDCGPCNPANSSECIGAVSNGPRYEMTGWPGFDHHSWHTYGLKWENTGSNASDQMTYSIDGAKMGVFKLRADEAAFKQDMFLIMNLALGGTLGGTIQITDWPNTYLDVDYIRWYRSGQPDQCGLDAGAPSACTGAQDGTACDDATLCNGHETCQAGVCSAGTPVTCSASDACHLAGACDASTGQCTNPVAVNGTACDDGTLCNGHETCQSGVCSAGTSVTCGASDACHVAGTCNPSTGQCSNPAAANGTSCDDSTLCNGHETCQAGVCTAGAAVTCGASDACHVAGTCNPSTGQCTNLVAVNGTACDDGTLCNGHETCQAGVCSAGTAVKCSAIDVCHSAGTCNPSTGQCTNPVAVNGTACDDGTLCNGHETCQVGVCTAGTAVTCGASDACHVAGTCNPSTGQCTNPVAANGTACDDGTLCNGHETCQAGVCSAGTAVKCSAIDVCHSAGTCNPSTGQCSNPAAANGTSCDDNTLCNGHETCQVGVCTAGTAVTCGASDACHVAGTCNPSTGQCTNPVAVNGTACDDGTLCNGHETCQAGVCAAGTAVTCGASDACHVAGTCNPSTGQCSNPAAANGTSCDDNTLCNGHETCQAGVCTAGAAVMCGASDACHVAGTCNPSTGQCSNPAAANGTSCDDSTLCNGHETCQAGLCSAGTPVTCAPPDECHALAACDSSTGLCPNIALADGTLCTNGACFSGVCVVTQDAGTEAAIPVDAAAGSDAGGTSGAEQDAGRGVSGAAGATEADAGTTSTMDGAEGGAAGARDTGAVMDGAAGAKSVAAGADASPAGATDSGESSGGAEPPTSNQATCGCRLAAGARGQWSLLWSAALIAAIAGRRRRQGRPTVRRDHRYRACAPSIE